MHRRSGAAGSMGAGRWLAAGYAGVAGFLVLEAGVRRRGEASSLETDEADRGTTRGIVRAYLLSAGLPLVLRRVPAPPLPRCAQPAGLALQVCGLTLRVWSMRTLGAFYSRTLRTQTEQQMVDTGPYRLVRHPGYLGSLMIWIGFALTSRSLPAVAGVTSLIARAYQRRIGVEEGLLSRELRGYDQYRSRTWKLVPFIW